MATYRLVIPVVAFWNEKSLLERSLWKTQT
jgi:hypothetical protein